MRKALTLLVAATVALLAYDYHVVANSKQIMKGIQKPAMDSLGAMLKAGGPKDDAEWEQAQQNAALLAETAQLLLMGSRPLDQDVWIKTSNRLHEAANASIAAAKEKNLDAWKSSLANMGGACKGCHNVHKKKKEGQP